MYVCCVTLSTQQRILRKESIMNHKMHLSKNEIERSITESLRYSSYTKENVIYEAFLGMSTRKRNLCFCFMTHYNRGHSFSIGKDFVRVNTLAH